MKIIFLDIDGVLNDFSSVASIWNDTPTDTHLKCLKNIVDQTGAEIVLSSTWRLGRSTRKIVEDRLADFGMKLFDCTKELEDRATEIEEWLSRHPEVIDYVILDDECLSLERLKARLVQTTIAYGLLPTHVMKAIKILNRSEKSAKLDAEAQKDE